MLVTLKLQPELIVEHPEIAIATAHDCFRHYHADFLGHYANIGFLFTIIDKSIEAEAIVETAKQFDVVLEPDIGAPPAAARHGPRATGTAANMVTARRAGVSHRCRSRRAGLLPRCLLAGRAALSPSCLLSLVGDLPVSRTLTRPPSLLRRGALPMRRRPRWAGLFRGPGPAPTSAFGGGPR